MRENPERRLTCAYCGKPLTAKQIGKRTQYCSKACSMFSPKHLATHAYDPDITQIQDGDVKWYIAGLMFTDGNISKDYKKLTISLTDQTVIEKLYPYFCDTNKRKIYEEQPLYKDSKKIYSLLNTNKNSIEWLCSLGLTPCKSNTKVLPNVPEKYVYSFIRGVFDGDGSISLNYCRDIARDYISPKKYGKLSIVSGSQQFAYGLADMFTKLGYTAHVHLENRRVNNENKTYYVSVNKQPHLRKLCEHLYKYCNDLCIQYKRDKFELV